MWFSTSASIFTSCHVCRTHVRTAHLQKRPSSCIFEQTWHRWPRRKPHPSGGAWTGSGTSPRPPPAWRLRKPWRCAWHTPGHDTTPAFRTKATLRTPGHASGFGFTSPAFVSKAPPAVQSVLASRWPEGAKWHHQCCGGEHLFWGSRSKTPDYRRPPEFNLSTPPPWKMS